MIRVAVLDMNNNEPNQGMRCITELLSAKSGQFGGHKIGFNTYDVRYKDDVPSLVYDVYICSGGPGSPYDGEGQLWERKFFRLVQKIYDHNAKGVGSKKYIFFICHSYQLMVRFFQLGLVTERKSAAFGVYMVHKTPLGAKDPVFKGLSDPFYAADFRSWQVVQPDKQRIAEMGGYIVAQEKIRPHVLLERATMGIRVTPEIVGTQFHPEADSDGLKVHFSKPEKRRKIVEKYGREKFEQIIRRLEDPRMIRHTHHTVLPSFLENAIYQLRGVPEAAGE